MTGDGHTQLPEGARWLQVGVRPATDPERHRELYRRIAQLARRLLLGSAARNFFYMHKPPGMRLRFELADRSPAGGDGDLPDAVDRQVARWRREQLIDQVEPGVYEPESQLFGGESSMRYVHGLFTVDSLAWLDYRGGGGPAGDDLAWLVSLAMLRDLFDELDIVDWEDLGVWDRLRSHAGRRLARPATELPGYPEVAGAIRATWRRPGQLVDRLPPAVRAIVADHREAMRPAVRRWRAGYFATRAASIGPRAAAACYVVFHWNRAALPAVRQALLAESLSEREGVAP